jgi:uncharacterized protein (TIGR00645 family)
LLNADSTDPTREQLETARGVGVNAARCRFGIAAAGTARDPSAAPRRNPMQRSNAFQATIFLSRWLLAPFLFGLALCLFLLLYRFFADFYNLAIELPKLTWHDLIVGVLNMIDIALTANLVLIVVFSSYENFVRRIGPEENASWPEGLTAIDFMALKQRLMGSIAVIAAVDALAWYLDIEKEVNSVKLVWVIAFPLMFVVAMLLLSIADWLVSRNHKVE